MPLIILLIDIKQRDISYNIKLNHDSGRQDTRRNVRQTQTSHANLN